jgi:DNA mismatch repair protein MutS
VPDYYIRKQTLSNCERYITQELKDMEATILGATDKICSLEYELFQQIRSTVAQNSERIQNTAYYLSLVDVYLSLATVASKNKYVCPDVDLTDVIMIKEGRHPVVEQFVKDSYFVPNDIYVDTNRNRLMLITGPNMAGKSTFMRQVALITIMAQIGSFVPADDARIGIVDKVFTRVGASDDLASGQSTFMLEMNEVAYILKNATKKSLIIYDEVGRGTSTFDGMSIARAIVEYTSGKKIGAKTLFATHYHELTSLEDEFDGIVNYNVAARKRGDTITFLRKIVRGSTDDSYGIEVAKLAGVPNEVIKRAREILSVVEQSAKSLTLTDKEIVKDDSLITIDDCIEEQIVQEIRAIDVNTLTPYEAMMLLYDLKKRLIE